MAKTHPHRDGYRHQKDIASRWHNFMNDLRK
jgi:hypothetical protein